MLGEWIKEKTERLTPQWGKSGKPLFRSPWVLASLAVVGIVFLIWPSGTPDSTPKKAALQEESALGDSPQAGMEKELSLILSQIDGVGAVNTSITLASDGEKTYAFNNKEESRAIEENDKTGGFRKTTELNSSRDLVVSSNQSPLLIERRAPQRKGVLVVADGAADPVIKEQIFDAVVTLLDISAARVKVLPREAY
jgi:stage III sporulation protein AG